MRTLNKRVERLEGQHAGGEGDDGPARAARWARVLGRVLVPEEVAAAHACDFIPWRDHDLRLLFLDMHLESRAGEASASAIRAEVEAGLGRKLDAEEANAFQRGMAVGCAAALFRLFSAEDIVRLAGAFEGAVGAGVEGDAGGGLV